MGGVAFSPDGGRLALSMNSATSPSDVCHRSRRDGLGALDAERSPAGWTPRGSSRRPGALPQLRQGRRQATHDPAFYYKPAKPSGALASKTDRIPGGHQHPGGPGQSLPKLQRHRAIPGQQAQGGVLAVPNIARLDRLQQTYLSLDNAEKREDSVKDIGALLDWIAKSNRNSMRRVSA